MDQLIAYLKANSVSQVTFAARIGVSQSALSKMCGGSITPRLQTALAISRETNGAVPVDVWDKPNDQSSAQTDITADQPQNKDAAA
jgi:transcriptional regulator with XRE-family HTH domain